MTGGEPIVNGGDFSNGMVDGLLRTATAYMHIRGHTSSSAR